MLNIVYHQYWRWIEIPPPPTSPSRISCSLYLDRSVFAYCVSYWKRADRIFCYERVHRPCKAGKRKWICQIFCNITRYCVQLKLGNVSIFISKSLPIAGTFTLTVWIVKVANYTSGSNNDPTPPLCQHSRFSTWIGSICLRRFVGVHCFFSWTFQRVCVCIALADGG